MHIEKRKIKGHTKFYLSHSYRDGQDVLKIRKYLGSDLSKEELAKAADRAKTAVAEQLMNYRDMHDPLKTSLAPEQISSLSKLKPIKIRHLDKAGWRAFTEVFTYNTNAIEGSTVTLKEVRDILENEKWPDASKEEISETYGVANAINHIRQTKEHVSKKLILDIHRMVFKNSKGFAGKFRAKGIEVVIRDKLGTIVHRGAPSEKIQSMLTDLVSWYNKSKDSVPPMVLAAVVHNQFETIHPFQDGNGRVGRLLMNNILIKHGLSPVNIQLKHRREYYLAIQAYQRKGNVRPLIDLMLREYKLSR